MPQYCKYYLLSNTTRKSKKRADSRCECNECSVGLYSFGYFCSYPIFTPTRHLKISWLTKISQLETRLGKRKPGDILKWTTGITSNYGWLDMEKLNDGFSCVNLYDPISDSMKEKCEIYISHWSILIRGSYWLIV